MRRVKLDVGLGVVAFVALAGCQTPFQGGEIFIFDYQIVTLTPGQSSSDMADALLGGAPASDLFNPNQLVCRAAFSGAEAPEMNRGDLPGDPGATVSLFRSVPRNVSSLNTPIPAADPADEDTPNPCADDTFRDFTAQLGPTLAVGATTNDTQFAISIDESGTLEPFASEALVVTLTDFDAATLVYQGEFELVAPKSGDASRVLVISEGRFVLR